MNMDGQAANKDCQIIHGNALDVLKTLESESLQCAITSPPYYGLRSYQTVSQVWDGDEFCDHVWGDEQIKITQPGRDYSGNFSTGKDKGTRGNQGYAAAMGVHASQGNYCQLCPAWSGELGLEPTFQLYISHLLQIFAEVKRILKPNGTCFVNLGDSFAGSGKGIGSDHGKGVFSDENIAKTDWSQITVRPKSLMNIPARFAIGMTDDLQMIQRNMIIWYKRACMPSSATDRFTVDFEPIYFFSKNPKYKFNQQLEAAISQNEIKILGRGKQGYAVASAAAFGQPQQDCSGGLGYSGNGDEKERNKRTTWDVPFEPSGDAHYASYPTKLVEPMILAGTDEGDTVLDIFAGTGTTLLTALRNKRRALGIELNESYIKISRKRLSEIQRKLFEL